MNAVIVCLAAFLGAATPFIIGGIRGEVRRRKLRRTLAQVADEFDPLDTQRSPFAGMRIIEDSAVPGGSVFLGDLSQFADAADQAIALTKPLPYDAADPLYDPVYARVVWVQGHRHSEPVCAWPECITYLTREQMAEMPDADAPPTLAERGEANRVDVPVKVVGKHVGGEDQ